jgi:zinc protease
MLGRGKSSYLYQELVRKLPVFTSIGAFMLGNLDPGLLIIEGKVAPGYEAEDARDALLQSIKTFVESGPTEDMVTKARNQAASSFEFNQVELLNRAMNLAYFELLGDADLLNKESATILSVTQQDVDKVARKILRPENASAILYKKNGVSVPELEEEEAE